MTSNTWVFVYHQCPYFVGFACICPHASFQMYDMYDHELHQTCLWWRFHIQELHALIIQNENSLYTNPLMDYVNKPKQPNDEKKFRKDMTLKMTLLMWKPTATFNALVSFVIGPDERFWLSMTN